MPELPEVEVLVRHLDPLLRGQQIQGVKVHRARVVRPLAPSTLEQSLVGLRLDGARRRGKFLRFPLISSRSDSPASIVGHLGMTGRMFVRPTSMDVSRHAVVTIQLEGAEWVFEDVRGFGQFHLDESVLSQLGPEPWDPNWTDASFAAALSRSSQPIKVKLLDQAVVAGVGNIYASEALFRAGIHPSIPSHRLTLGQLSVLRRTILEVLEEAIRFGSSLPLNFAEGSGGLFYYGTTSNPDFYEERLRVYNRAGLPCRSCGSPIEKCVQAARSTFFCPQCQAKPS